MNEPLSFSRTVNRSIFVILLLYVLAAPQLRSPSPGPGFDVAAEWLASVSFLEWVLFAVGVLFLIAVATTISRLRYQIRAVAGQVESVPAATLPISEAVKSSQGGNGLASAPFKPYLAFLDLAGWMQIQDPGKECLVIDARTTIRKTSPYAAPLRLIGKPISARRVLLSPAALEDVSATSLTADQLDLTLKVTVKYTVADPAYVASLEAPLSELTNLLTGVIAELVRTRTLEDIVKDDGALRREIKQRMEESTTIHTRYQVIEVLKALPTGDERLIEIINQTREAVQRRALVDQEGRNQEIIAEYEVAIERSREELRDEFEQREHERGLGTARLVGELGVQREFMRTIAAFAASAIDPSDAIREIQSMIFKERPQEAAALPDSANVVDARMELERRSLERIQGALRIKQFDVTHVQGSPDKPGSAVISLDGFEVLIDCPIGYPDEAPTVCLRLEGEETPVVVPWREGSYLSDAATAAVMQARILVDNEAEQ